MSRIQLISLATVALLAGVPNVADSAPPEKPANLEESTSATILVPASSVAWLPPAVAAWAPAIDLAARTHGVDARLVAVVIFVESRGQVDAVSSAGALGLMQLMPATAGRIARSHGLPVPSREALLKPSLNIDLGTRHLADLIADFGDPSLDDPTVHRVATAYNGGAAVLLDPRTPSAETRRYATRVLQLWRARERATRP